ncbi:Ni/Fe hydrogenase subunit alpha [Nocardioides panacihumi]|uniref:Ni/Fe hydrogenase subunit alpha n=1 Tax=Nocardioides panacihumi TaxID=400774 RepID=A0ABN2RUY7_9ACTN
MTHRHKDGGHVLHVGTLARVEGEGAMHISYRAGEVADVQLRIYEPPRFYEAFLRGRAHTEPPDITARICGICPVAYQTSACWAIEDACGVAVTGEIRALRRLLYCGEWIESHALHVYLLHAPDFLGYDGAVELAADHPAVVERGLRLKKAGNRLMEVVGGRSVHPINVRVGGFYRFPSAEELRAIRPDLERALEDALETVRLVAGFDFPDFEQPYEYLALRPEAGYPIEAGRVVSTGGADFEVRDFATRIEEMHLPHSNALHSRLDGGIRGPYAVGPLARYTLNSDRLSPLAHQAASEAGLGDGCRNPFRSIIVRAVELVEACHEALRIVDGWTGSGPASVPVPPRAGAGFGASEAPRGVLFHRYAIDDTGIIRDAQIVPPTSQNQTSIEADLRAMVGAWIDLDEHALQHRCEHAIRNYDPCISCATHFLDLTVERS